LDEAAILLERIGYFVGRGGRRALLSVADGVKGDAISVNSPRINTDGAMPNI